MKKYSKPKIEFEIFTVSDNIATSCNADTGWLVRGMHSIHNCYAESNMFKDFIGGRPYIAHEMCTYEMAEEYCETLLTDELMMFHSY